VRIEWGKFQSMGEAFEILASNVEKPVIFQRIGGPCRDRTYDQLIKRVQLLALDKRRSSTINELSGAFLYRR
jgi:hypothetical protein